MTEFEDVRGREGQDRTSCTAKRVGLDGTGSSLQADLENLFPAETLHGGKTSS